MDVRPAHPRDAEAFARVVAAVAEEGRYVLTEPPVEVAAFAARVRATLEAGRDRLWVLEHEGEVVGCLGLHAVVPGVVSLGMSILAAHRGRGGGGALLDAALAHARRAGLAKVELEVFPDNARAVALYASRGFEVEGLRRAHYPRRDGSRRSALLMALLLPAARRGPTRIA
jgi:putative acetyltransferase